MKKLYISSLIDFKGAKYVVPKYINKKVLIMETEKNIYINNSNLKLICTYEKKFGIHYTLGLYNIEKMKNKAIDDFIKRVENNLFRLA